jgi:hypothetical protein
MGVLLLQANAGKVPLKDGIVQTIVTSPPYYGLRDYGISDQIGLEPTLQEYIENLMTVFDECWRVLRDDGTMWLNLGDSYMTQPSWGRDKGTSTLGGRKTNEIPRDRLGQRKRGSHPELKIKGGYALDTRLRYNWKDYYPFSVSRDNQCLIGSGIFGITSSIGDGSDGQYPLLSLSLSFLLVLFFEWFSLLLKTWGLT